MSLGHTPEVWAMDVYQRLMLQAADWVTGG